MNQNDTRARVMSGCPIGCRSDLEETGVTLAIGRLLRCSECGHLVNNVTVGEYQASLTKWDTAAGTLPNERAVERYRKVITRRLTTAERIMRRAPAPDAKLRLLDVGCSSGALLKVAQDIGFDVAGVEPAAEAAATAKASGFDVFNGYLADAQYPAESFDVVTLFELVEHLTDPLALLRECARVTKPGGMLIVNTPNADSYTAHFMRGNWDGFDLVIMGGHISFFTPASMRLLADRCGFDVDKVETRNIRFWEEGQRSRGVYKTGRILSQLLAYPTKLAGRGHDLLAYMTRR
jgi:2-polyprenyl-3-methyl-5-hydroxy-6-metoxy-1,4-benzoquinol methylase